MNIVIVINFNATKTLQQFVSIALRKSSKTLPCKQNKEQRHTVTHKKGSKVIIEGNI